MPSLPRLFVNVSVNVANIYVRGNSTNENMRITRSSRQMDVNEMRNELYSIVSDEDEDDLNPDNNTINLDDSIAIRNTNITNVMEIVESADNHTINLEDSTAIEIDVDDEVWNGGDSDVEDLTDGQDVQVPVSSSMNSRTPRRQLPQLEDSNVIDLTNSPTPSFTSLPTVSASSSKASSNRLAGCSICLDTYVEIKDVGKTLMSTTCGHVFCSTCLESSLKNNGNTCPVCRKRLKNGDYHPLYL